MHLNKIKQNPIIKPLLVLKRSVHHMLIQTAKMFLAKKKVQPIRVSNWPKSLSEPTDFYIWTYRYFHQHLPENIRAHRYYFEQKKRGFGERAFHTMWFLLFKEFKIQNFLEIGVYRGQVLSLLALLQESDNIDGEVVGISPFSDVGDSVSNYAGGIDYYEDTMSNFRHFGLRMPRLIEAYSMDKAAVDVVSEKPWDCIYIDGSHEYEIVKEDWLNCSRNVKVDGLIVLDDSTLETIYRPPVFASKGHPGPSRLAMEIDNSFREILRVGHNRVFQRIS